MIEPHSGYESNGEQVPAVDFVYPSYDPVIQRDDPDPDALRLARQETVIRLLDWLTRGHETERIGRRTVYLAFILHPNETQRELAGRLGLTPGRVSQELNDIREDISNLHAGLDGVSMVED